MIVFLNDRSHRAKRLSKGEVFQSLPASDVTNISFMCFITWQSCGSSEIKFGLCAFLLTLYFDGKVTHKRLNVCHGFPQFSLASFPFTLTSSNGPALLNAFCDEVRLCG